MTSEGTPSYDWVEDRVRPIETRLEKLIQVHKADFEVQKRIFLVTQRHLVRFEVNFMQLHMKEAIDLKFSGSKRRRIQEYIVTEYTKAIEDLEDSTKPLSIASAFKQMCVQCSDKYELDAFTDYTKERGSYF